MSSHLRVLFKCNVSLYYDVTCSRPAWQFYSMKCPKGITLPKFPKKKSNAFNEELLIIMGIHGRINVNFYFSWKKFEITVSFIFFISPSCMLLIYQF